MQDLGAYFLQGVIGSYIVFSKCLLGVKQEGACKSSTAFFEEFRIQGSVRVLQGLFILLEGVLLEFHEGLF